MPEIKLDEVRGDLLERCSNISFEEIEAFKKHEEAAQAIIEIMPFITKKRGLRLADEYTAAIVTVSEEFYLKGFAECLKILSTMEDKTMSAHQTGQVQFVCENCGKDLWIDPAIYQRIYENQKSCLSCRVIINIQERG